MKIVMMARNPDLYSHQRLKEAAETRGHSLDIVNTLRCYMNIASRRPQIYYNGEELTGYDAVIPRIGASVRADDWCRRTLPLRRGRRSDMARLGSVRARNQPGRRWTICRGHSHYIE